MPDKDKFLDDGYPVFSGYRITGYYSEYMVENPTLIVVARGVGGTGDVKISPPNLISRIYLSLLILMKVLQICVTYIINLFAII